MSAFPEYAHEESTVAIRAHFAGAAACWIRSHEALLRDDKRLAFEEMEKCLSLVIDARKALLAQAPVEPATAEPEVTAPMKCPHGTDLDIPCVECMQAEEKTK